MVWYVTSRSFKTNQKYALIVYISRNIHVNLEAQNKRTIWRSISVSTLYIVPVPVYVLRLSVTMGICTFFFYAINTDWELTILGVKNWRNKVNIKFWRGLTPAIISLKFKIEPSQRPSVVIDALNWLGLRSSRVNYCIDHL